MFVSLFFITRFYFDYPYIIVAISLTWVPQIIHNVVYNNRLALPLVVTILYSLNKIMLPLYFRGYPKNIFHLKTNTHFVYWSIGIVCIEIFVLLAQSLISPRFFIPFKFGQLSDADHRFYYTKEELIQLRSDLEFSECAICLYPLFTINGFEENSDIIDEGTGTKPNKFKHVIRKSLDILFNFHELTFRARKPFMFTPCNHAFHSSCLESWLKMKKECPTDRTILPSVGLN